jgi:hypothetical protein
LQRHRQLLPDLLLLMWWEDIDNAIDRLRSILRVQCCEDQMSGFGCCQCDLNRLEVPHLTDEDDVRILSQDMLESI